MDDPSCRKEIKTMKHIIFIIIFLVTAAFSFTVHASDLKPPSTGIDKNAIGGLGKFFSPQYKNRALTEEEIIKDIGPVTTVR